MHSIRHWTIRYLFNRLNEKNYRRHHPDNPWLAPEANRFLETYLKSSDKGLEFGSGRSTIWFTQHIKHLTSVEHNFEWYSHIAESLKKTNINNVTYHYFPKSKDDPSGTDSAYVKVVTTIPETSLNFVLVDGIYRAQCVLQSIPLLLPGGILIIDNVNKSLPSDSFAPNSRTKTQGPINSEWEKVLEKIGSWRFYWTGNGVSDTAIYFKPLE